MLCKHEVVGSIPSGSTRSESSVIRNQFADYGLLIADPWISDRFLHCEEEACPECSGAIREDGLWALRASVGEADRYRSRAGWKHGLWSVPRARARASIDDESDQVPKGRSVDALALRGDEGRGTLR